MRTPEVEKAIKWLADMVRLGDLGVDCQEMKILNYARKLEGEHGAATKEALRQAVERQIQKSRAEKAEAALAEEKKKREEAEKEIVCIQAMPSKESLAEIAYKLLRTDLDALSDKLKASNATLDACRQARVRDRETCDSLHKFDWDKLQAAEKIIDKLASYCRKEGEISTGKMAEYMGVNRADILHFDNMNAKFQAANERIEKMATAMTEALNLMGGPTMDYAPSVALDEWRRRWKESCDRLAAALSRGDG